MRAIEISRQEAEDLTDLLWLADATFPLETTESDIRKLFGMCTRDESLESMGTTLDVFRRTWAETYLKTGCVSSAMAAALKSKK